jgi:RimJ/RimL family protein N-acetyltransferase
VADDWRQGLPVLHGPSVTLREPRLTDAAALCARLTTPPVTRYISTPPTTPEGFERFISWLQHERSLGRLACFGIVPDGMSEPVGLLQVRELEATFGIAEWGFALGEAYWGTGVFMASAPLVLDFAFRDARLHRIEARASVENERANKALQKLGAVFEGILRESFRNEAVATDQALWAIVADDWLAAHPEPCRRTAAPAVQPPEAAWVDGERAVAAWRAGLPELRAAGVTLRELQMEDAESLTSQFSDSEVGLYIPPPPASAGDFLRFIQWAHKQRETGTILCFAAVPDGRETAVGIIQMHELEPPFRIAEWGFVFGRAYWGTGLFHRGAELLLDFAFDTVGVHRLEARAMAANVRANAALRKLGAVKEGQLSRSFLLGGQYHDDLLWSILAADWRRARSGPA